MSQFRVGNAPCSWGSLEFEGTKGEAIGYWQMLDELAETGYTGTELGDWGYMPTDPAQLRDELDRRGLVMLGAFVPVAMKNRSAHAAGIANAVKTAKLLAAVASDPKPFLVLADDNGSVPERTRNAGRVTPRDGLEWRGIARLRGRRECHRRGPSRRRPGLRPCFTITVPATWKRRTRSRASWT